MNPELEYLINMALADGEVTEKEREIILRKAKILGEDKEEVEMILNGKIAQLKNEKEAKVLPNTFLAPPLEKKSNKEGDLKKCPSCGAPIKSFNTTCPECSHEFKNVGVNSTIDGLLKELRKIKRSDYKFDDGYEQDRAGIIRSFPIPTTKEDLLEFATKSVAEIDDSKTDLDEDSKAWNSKCQEVINKLHIISINDSSILPVLERIERVLKEKNDHVKSNNKKDSWVVIVVSIVLFVILPIVIYLFKKLG